MPNTKAIPPEATGSPGPTAVDLSTRLAGLRADIDGIDDQLHDLLMRRAAVVEQVAGLGRIGKIPFRPGREAAIIRRLLARHAGRLPRRAIVRLWREMFAANISIEARFLIATCDPGSGDQLVQVAREHFGALTPLRVCRSPAQALAEVRSGEATAAVLPMPAEEEPAARCWWTALLRHDSPRLHVVGRLPFWQAPRPEGAVPVEALVVAAAAPDRSGDARGDARGDASGDASGDARGDDRTLIGFELADDSSRAGLTAALTAAGMEVASLLLRRDPAGGAGHGLIDVAGFVAEGDGRLRGLAGAVVLGSYAVPVEAAES